jgi:hypothetical protein
MKFLIIALSALTLAACTPKPPAPVDPNASPTPTPAPTQIGCALEQSLTGAEIRDIICPGKTVGQVVGFLGPTSW